MGSLIIRRLDDTELIRLSEIAKKKGKSREDYMRDVIRKLLVSDDLLELDFKYSNLVNLMSDNAKMMIDVIDRNTYVLDEVLGRLDGEEE